MNSSKELLNQLHAKQDEAGRIVGSFPTVADWTADAAESFKRLQDEMSDLGKKYDELSDRETKAAALKRDIETRNTPVNSLDTPRHDQKASEPEEKSLGQLFTESPSFKSFRPGAGNPPASVTADVKALLTLTGYATQNIRLPKLVESAQRIDHVADLIPQGRTNGNAVVFMVETTFTNAAATVAEGGTKPEATLAFTETTFPVRKIAVNLPVTDELLADAPAMETYINGRLREMLMLVEDVQLITGSGVAPNLTGFLSTAGLQTQAKGADPTPDAIYKAMTKVRVAGRASVSGVIFHPNDWQDVRLLRTADGIYIWGSPADTGVDRIWGVPVQITDAMTENTALVGDFRTHSMIFRRAEVTLQASTEHSTYFAENKILIQAEERLALVIFRGAAFCQVTGV